MWTPIFTNKKVAKPVGISQGFELINLLEFENDFWDLSISRINVLRLNQFLYQQMNVCIRC